MRKNKKRTKKIRNLIFVCVLSAILLTVSTYAWFIGMQTVRVSSFEINIASTDGLSLSLDGVTWSSELDTTTATAYTGNTNQWLTETDAQGKLISKGLKPVSTVGDINTTASRLNLYEKGSLTATKGGYRLLTSLVDNDGEKEADGYVAFDLFIRNMSGEAYYAENNPLNEEAVFLTYNSDVTVGTSGTENTGIENSVRVAFAQIGRVENKVYEDATTVTGITCADTYTDEENETGQIVTGICRPAQIWEPNDTDHVDNAISWYKKSCTERTGTVTDGAVKGFSYATKTESAGSCSDIADGNAYPTYAISRAIDIADYVDVYDGAKYNKFSNNTVEPDSADATPYTDYLTAKEGEDFDAADYKLVAVDTFTETEQAQTGTDRNIFITLAPNSITKVRVYVYIEGQDIDNYDFAQLGKAIKINFGFTKERYTTDDFSDEPVTVIPGAENTKKVAYNVAAATTITNVVGGNSKTVVWDQESKGFYYHKDETVTSFTFTEVTTSEGSTTEKEKTATYDADQAKWIFADKAA